jgi:hypothetical protein
MPGPSYTLVHSTDSVSDLNTASSQTSSTTVRTPLSVSSSTTATASTTTTHSLPSLNLSTVSIETLTNIPTISIAQTDTNGTILSPDIGDQTDDQNAKKPDTAAIIGGSVGGLAFIALIAAFILLYRRLKNREKQYQMQHGSSAFLPPITGRDGHSPEPAWSMSSHAYPLEKRRPPFESANSSVYQIPDTPHQSVTPAEVTPEGSATNPRTSSDYVSNTPDTPTPNPAAVTAQAHPRSTHALIAAAAPPDMSQEQINRLAENFVSLVRGRQAEYDDLDEDARNPPPYRAD